MRNPLFLKLFLPLLSAAVATACSSSAISPESAQPAVPAEWARGGDAGNADLNWLDNFGSERLEALVAESIAANYQVKQERALLYQAEQAVVIVGADRFPSLDVSLDGSRRSVEDTTGASVSTNSYTGSLDARWQVDLWGQLSDEQQAAQLDLAAQAARLLALERDVAALTATAVFEAMEAKQLLAVAERRLDNALESRDIVASGYRQGLNDALDLYLARSQVERQVANVAQSRQDLLEVVTNLQLVLARYPDGSMAIDAELPVINDPLPTGLPSELLTRRADLQAAWLNLLSTDAELAAAHKARFPSLVLVGSTGVASAEFADLLDGDGAAWSIAGGLTQPLFQAGRLQALERQALARVQFAEQQYLERVYGAFADVENAISRSASLAQRYDALLEAESNASAALELALEQYQRGLVPYTTVLESQRQAFDAEATVVQLKGQLLQNRVALYLALGGEFATQ